MSELRNKQGLTEAEFLKQYKPGDFERPSVTVDNLLFTVDKNLDHLKVLLIQRGNHPYMGCYALPGGFVDMKESAFTAAGRELQEETGLQGIYLEQLYTYTNPNRDPRMRVIDIAYMALIPMTEVVAGDDAADAAWFDVTLGEEELVLTNAERKITIRCQLEKKTFQNGVISYQSAVPKPVGKPKLAFDHSLIITDGIKRLRNKAEYTDIVFNLMGPRFTLPDLQRVYEIILGRPLFKKNFRDKIKDKVTETGAFERSVKGKRSSALFRYNDGR